MRACPSRGCKYNCQTQINSENMLACFHQCRIVLLWAVAGGGRGWAVGGQPGAGGRRCLAVGQQAEHTKIWQCCLPVFQNLPMSVIIALSTVVPDSSTSFPLRMDFRCALESRMGFVFAAVSMIVSMHLR